jgi:S1-C subfamily serine protease
MNLRWPTFILLALPLLANAAVRSSAARLWESSTVALEVSSKQYNYLQPWWRGSQTVLKPGVVLNVKKQTLLTTAFGLGKVTVVRAQSNGRGRWFDAEVEWADADANIALVTVKDAEFWKGLKPVRFANSIPDNDGMQIVRWRTGSLELRKAEFNRYTVSNPTGGDAAHVVLEVNSEIDGTGWGEPLVANGRLLGLVFASQGNLSQILTAPFIKTVLKAHADDTYTGLGYFDFTWQQTANPDTLRYLGLPESSQGVVIIDVPKHSPTTSVLQPRDVILKVGNYTIDNEGDYEDPLYGHLMLEALSTRDHWAGQSIPMTIWRNNQEQTVQYTLRPIRHAARLVPEESAAEAPQYLIAGGLIFQPLTRNYLRSWGPAWERSAPFRLAYFRSEEPTPEKPGLVILTSVLPDSINLGYQEAQQLVLEKVNGQPISSLPALQEALNQPRNGFHLFEFMGGESLQRIVLDASQVSAANQRILQRYGIESVAEITAEEKP